MDTAMMTLGDGWFAKFSRSGDDGRSYWSERVICWTWDAGIWQPVGWVPAGGGVTEAHSIEGFDGYVYGG
jgi:hypothetical protein